MRFRSVALIVLTLSQSQAALAQSSAARVGTIDVGDARINYEIAGAGPAVVLIHGWALDRREWHDQMAALSSRFRVIALDRRGFGKSTGVADLSADPGDLRAVLDTLGVRSAVLIGHSDGAEAAYRFTAAMPERVEALVLYGGRAPAGFPIPPTEPLGPPFAKLVLIARRYGLDSVMRAFTARPQFQHGARPPALQARLDSIRADYSGRDLLEDHSPSDRFPMAQFDAVRRWNFPILFISGEREAPRWHLVADSLARWMPNARKVVIPGGGHAVHFDEPEKFNRALLQFLNDVTKLPPRP
jgi:pimeloyl-ACP methyl ester carboxylesterase